MSPPLETVLKGRFVLKEMIGKGAMGTVYKAVDRMAEAANDRNPYVAIKVLNPELAHGVSFFKAMQREAKNTMKLAHPNIVLLRDFDKDGPYTFLCMEFLEGRSLQELIASLPAGGMKFADAWPLIQGMGEALKYAHERKIVHSDFKPGNVFVTDTGIKVLDFGIAKPIEDDGRTRLVEIEKAYTPAYSTVEQMAGDIPDSRDDIYSLSCVIYELLAGMRPYGASSAKEALRNGLKPKPLAALKNRQWHCLERGLALQRKSRLASVHELLAGLSPAREEPKHRQTALMAASLVLGTVGAGAGGYLYWMDSVRQPAPAVSPQPVLPVLPGKNSGTSADGTLTMALDSREYGIGQILRVEYAVAKPLYLRLLMVNSSGKKDVLYPADNGQDARLEPGKVYQYPDVDADYDLQIQGPPGVDTLFAIASGQAPVDASIAIDENGNPFIPEGLPADLTVLKLQYQVVRR